VKNISAHVFEGCPSFAEANAQLAACYHFDEVATYAGLHNVFADASSNHIPDVAAAHSSPYLLWCVNVDDEGQLRLDNMIYPAYDARYLDWSATKMWGYCASKPRLQGAGFDYSEAAMEAANAHRLAGTADVLAHYLGCSSVPLQLEHITAGWSGGAIYYDSCLKLNKACFAQGIGNQSSSRAVLLRHNKARAGGAVFVECQDLGSKCTEAFSDANKIGALPLLPKAEFTNNTASIYGNTITTKPFRMELRQRELLTVVDLSETVCQRSFVGHFTYLQQLIGGQPTPMQMDHVSSSISHFKQSGVLVLY